jgi:hypothetical protein
LWGVELKKNDLNVSKNLKQSVSPDLNTSLETNSTKKLPNTDQLPNHYTHKTVNDKSGFKTFKQSAASAAGDPMAPIIQFTIQDTLAVDSHKESGVANRLTLQPVIPIAPGKIIPYIQVARVTFDVLSTTTSPDSQTGIGDLTAFDQFIVKRSRALSLGVGAIVVLPTASDDKLGQGKYQIGPSFSFLSNTGKWQFGSILQDQFSVGGQSDRDYVHEATWQPILNYVTGKWYFGVGDFSWTLDWHNQNHLDIPLAFQVGYVTKIGEYNYNFSIEPYKMLNYSGPSENWGIRFGLVLMLPE